MIPIPTKLYWIGGGALALFLAVGIWFRAHDARVRKEAVAAAVIEAVEIERAKSDSMNEIMRDSLRDARDRTDVIKEASVDAGQSYNRQRAAINVAAPRPAGVPDGSVVVPLSFVQAADSLAKLVPILLTTITIERAASERRIEALIRTDSLSRVEIEQLKIQVKAAGPGITGRLKWAAIGGAVAFGAFTLLKGN